MKDVIMSNPRGSIISVTTPTGKMRCKLEWTPDFKSRTNGNFNRGQAFLDNEVIKLCDKYVPFDTGVLKTSALLYTQIGSGVVTYNTPYARAQYYGHFKHRGKRDRLWFELVKATYKEVLRKGVWEFLSGRNKTAIHNMIRGKKR